MQSQQVLYEIRNGMMQGIIPKNTPVKVFSPTIEEITNLYTKYSENENIYNDYFSGNMFTDIFNINDLKINSTQLSNNAYDFEILSGEIAVMTSGMITSGFSKEILKEYIGDASTNFISVSYQDPDEIGGRVFRGDEIIRIDDTEYKMKAKIFKSSAFSGYANVSQIYNIFGQLSPEQIMIVHLNDYDNDNLVDYYASNFKASTVVVPEFNKTYLLYQY